MAKDTRNVPSVLSGFFSEATIEHSARCTGFGKQVSKMSGKLFRALITFGV